VPRRASIGLFHAAVDSAHAVEEHPRMRALRLLAVSTAALLAGASAAVARADVIAVTDNFVSASEGTDVALINASTVADIPLPAGINTTDDESHPSISADGKKLVFERRNPSTGSDRIILADLSTGATSDLFTGFEVSAIHPRSPSITPDGTGVLTGALGSGPLLTDVSNFPGGPYPHTDIGGRSQTFDPVATGSAPGSLLAFDEVGSGSGERNVRFGKIGQTIFGSGGILGEHNAHPAIASPGGVETIVFDFADITGGTADSAHLETCSPGSAITAGCSHGTLPGTSSTHDQSRPAFTGEGRYVGFIRKLSDASEELKVWDSGTQTVIASIGLGTTPDDTGSLSLYEHSILTLAHIDVSGLLSFRLRVPANIGILVQRVTGHRKLFGRTAPKLGKPLRVPLGAFKRGKGHVRWNRKVAGRALHRGTYQVTVRALTHSGKVRDLGKPQLVHVAHG
jgi:hypothetical protein